MELQNLPLDNLLDIKKYLDLTSCSRLSCSNKTFYHFFKPFLIPKFLHESSVGKNVTLLLKSGLQHNGFWVFVGHILNDEDGISDDDATSHHVNVNNSEGFIYGVEHWLLDSFGFWIPSNNNIDELNNNIAEIRLGQGFLTEIIGLYCKDLYELFTPLLKAFDNKHYFYYATILKDNVYYLELNPPKTSSICFDLILTITTLYIPKLSIPKSSPKCFDFLLKRVVLNTHDYKLILFSVLSHGCCSEEYLSILNSFSPLWLIMSESSPDECFVILAFLIQNNKKSYFESMLSRLSSLFIKKNNNLLQFLLFYCVVGGLEYFHSSKKVDLYFFKLLVNRGVHPTPLNAKPESDNDIEFFFFKKKIMSSFVTLNFTAISEILQKVSIYKSELSFRRQVMSLPYSTLKTFHFYLQTIPTIFQNGMFHVDWKEFVEFLELTNGLKNKFSLCITINKN